MRNKNYLWYPASNASHYIIEQNARKVNTKMNIPLNNCALFFKIFKRAVDLLCEVNMRLSERKWVSRFCAAAIVCVLIFYTTLPSFAAESDTEEGKKYIRWIDLNVTRIALEDALSYDVETRGKPEHMRFATAISYMAYVNGGEFSKYRKGDLKKWIGSLSKNEDGSLIFPIPNNKELLAYYLESYEAVLGGMVGPYVKVTVKEDGSELREEGYGLRACSPIAYGYSTNHYDDFGAARSYGYKRPHLGHDIVGSIGTPIVAVESGYVEALGWNQYGGWRIGVRSFDGKRYYYYAHLRKGHPYADLYEGKIIHAGEVIGYLGMTGYSAKEDTNNISIPHLHYGLEIIFDPSQKDGWNQIWVSLYELTEFLKKNSIRTFSDTKTMERRSYVYYVYPEAPDE